VSVAVGAVPDRVDGEGIRNDGHGAKRSLESFPEDPIEQMIAARIRRNDDLRFVFLDQFLQMARSGIVAFAVARREDEDGFHNQRLRLKRISMLVATVAMKARQSGYPYGQLSSGIFQGWSRSKFMP